MQRSSMPFDANFLAGHGKYGAPHQDGDHQAMPMTMENPGTGKISGVSWMPQAGLQTFRFLSKGDATSHGSPILMGRRSV
ncbi:MAG: hypothetical protein Q8K57_05050 [Thiobacillus sp.]|nr:hypothetical protein [Thiobacillus sp.]